MFEVWNLKRRIQSIERSYAKERDELEKGKASEDDLQRLESSEFYAVRELEKEIDQIVSLRLSHEARSLDVETPPITDKEMWDEEFGRIWFTSRGRAHVRKLIHEERTRRFEAKSRWLPLLSVLLGIIGMITGLVAVLQQKKSAEAATTAAETARIGVELARKQMEGIGAAIVELRRGVAVDFTIPPSGEVRFNLMNNGHVIAHDVHLSLTLFLKETAADQQERKIFSRNETIPSIPPAAVITRPDFIYPFELTEKEHKLVLNTAAYIVVEGAFDYQNGFDTRVGPQRFCYAYVWGSHKFGRWSGVCNDVQSQIHLAGEMAKPTTGR